MDFGGIGGGLIQVAGDLAGGYLQSRYNAKEASKNRNFQREMSNTAYQRAAADLNKAGLNRVLALGNPASTPAGSSASISAPELGSSFTQGASAATARQLQRSQVALTDQQAELASAQAAKARAETELLPIQGEQLLSQSSLNASAMGRNYADTKRLEQMIPVMLQDISTSKALERLHNANASDAEIRRVWQKEAYDRLMPLARRLLDSFDGGSSSAKFPDLKLRDRNIQDNLLERLLDFGWKSYKKSRADGASGDW